MPDPAARLVRRGESLGGQEGERAVVPQRARAQRHRRGAHPGGDDRTAPAHDGGEARRLLARLGGGRCAQRDDRRAGALCERAGGTVSRLRAGCRVRRRVGGRCHALRAGWRGPVRLGDAAEPDRREGGWGDDAAEPRGVAGDTGRRGKRGRERLRRDRRGHLARRGAVDRRRAGRERVHEGTRAARAAQGRAHPMTSTALLPDRGLARWWVYQRERFPLVAHAPLIAAFSSAAVCLSALLRGESRPRAASPVVAFVTALCFFFQLRVADEFKDAEDDARHRPYRPVPRGLVTLRELGSLGVAAALVQLGAALWFDVRLVPLLLAVWAYMALMSKEFFVR